MDFSKDDIVIKKERDESDDRRWIVIKVFKETVWVKGIIDNVVVNDFLYKGVKKDIFEVIGRRRKII